MDIAELTRLFVTLFVIISPLGAVPLFLAMTVTDSLERRRRTGLIAAVTTTITLIAAALLGDAAFRFFGITLDAFRIAGGVILFLYALDMIQMRQTRMSTTDPEMEEGVQRSEVGVIPLGIPMLAGPGSITSVLVMRIQGGEAGLWPVLIAVILGGLSVLVCFWFAVAMQRWLTPVLLGILLRLEGLLLAAIAVQMLIVGLGGAFPGIVPRA